MSKQSATEATNPVGENHAVAANSHDWYYGTEELLHALPRRWTRSLLYLLVIFSAIVLPWRMLLQVEIIPHFESDCYSQPVQELLKIA
ncbi:MAG: hypothetical protein ICV78_12630 [Tolypothrix sp. Co-bin9]|nr:hypothetical protein [Tolypothrix sp. Co-bin9]